jgi:hypothetical protein
MLEKLRNMNECAKEMKQRSRSHTPKIRSLQQSMSSTPHQKDINFDQLVKKKRGKIKLEVL